MTKSTDNSPFISPSISLEEATKIVNCMTESQRLQLALHALRPTGTAPSINPAPLLDTVVRPKRLRENCFALLIGIGKFADAQFGKNGYPEDIPIRDVTEVMNCLINHCGYLSKNIRYFFNEDAKERDIQRELTNLKRLSDQNEIDQLVIFLSSHGYTVFSGSDESPVPEYIFIAHDTEHDMMFNEGASAIKAETIAKLVSRISAKEKLVFIDTCHAGYFSGSMNVLAIAEQYVLSCGPKEKSYVLMDERISIFSKCLVDALSGKAANRPDGTVTADDVMNYLWQTVRPLAQARHQREQQPVLSGRSSGAIVLIDNS